MKKKQLLAFLFAAFSFVFTGEALADGIVKNELRSQGKKRSYYLFVPKSVSKDKPAPLLMMLHGSGRNGKILVEHWQKLAEKEGIILAGPDARNSAEWHFPKDGPEFIYNLTEELKLKYPVDSRRVYLFGHSAGAIFGLYLSMLESKYFAATAVSAGAIMKQKFTLLDEAERKIPIALFVGTKDPLFPLPEVRQTRDAFIERKFEVELTEIPDLNHNYYSRSKEINEKAWNFLKKFQLEDKQQYKQHRFKSDS